MLHANIMINSRTDYVFIPSPMARMQTHVAAGGKSKKQSLI